MATSIEWGARGLLFFLSGALLGGCAMLEEAGLGLGLGGDETIQTAPPDAGLPDAPDLYAQGKQHLVAGRLGLAVAAFRADLARDPGSVEALNGLGAAYDRMGRHDLAARAYEMALERKPGEPRTLNNIGISYLMQKRWDRAAAFLRGAYARDRGSAAILSNRRVAEAALARAGGPPVRGVESANMPESKRPRIGRISRGVYQLITRPTVAAPAQEDPVMRRRTSALPDPPVARTQGMGHGLALGYLSSPMGDVGRLRDRAMAPLSGT